MPIASSLKMSNWSKINSNENIITHPIKNVDKRA